MHLSPRKALILSGLTWLAIGVWLVIFGLGLLGDALQEALLSPDHLDPFLGFVSEKLGGVKQTGVLLVAGGLLLGYFKARFIFSKTVKRISKRFYSFRSKIPLGQVYSKGYLILIGCMILLGMSIKWLGIYASARGFIDTAIGSALVNGSLLFFQEALLKRVPTKA